MTTDHHANLHLRMEAVLTDPGFQNELAQVRSKATLRTIGDSGSSPRWTYAVNRFSRNSAAALYALESSALATPDFPLEHDRERSRQLALAWESLARLGEGVTRPTALINAALAYELAGYQANAAYLAKEIWSEPHLNSRADGQSLVASFIQRRLIVTARLADRVMRDPPDSESTLDALSLELGEVVLADGLSNACRFFLSGDQSAYQESVELLQEATAIFDGIGAPLQANVAYGIRSVLPLMMRRSTWVQLEQHSRTSEVWKRYLTLLARPLSRGVTELWPSQIRVLESGFLGSDDSAVVRLPTSGGKTRIAEMAIIDTFQRHPGAKCVFVAPYRALASEVERTLGSVLNDLGYRVSSVVGSYESDEFEEFLLRTADLLIVTPEKLDLVLRLRPEISDQFRLVVLDEVHMMDDAQRGIKFELLLSRMKHRIPTCRFLVMSAVISDSTLQAFAAWLADSPERSVTSDWRPTIQRRARFEWQSTAGVIRFERDPEIPDLNTFVPGILQRREYSFINPDTQRSNTRKYPKAEKGDTAAELAYTFSEQGPVLVFCTQPNWVESVCKGIINKSIHYRRLVGEPVYPHFGSVVQTRSLELAREWLGAEHIISQALSAGIAPHHGRIPNVVREAIETDCRAGRYRVVVATNTLAQGVNLPVRTVIVHSTWRADEEGQRSRIPVRDYWNIAGRAGRAGMETEGLIVHITLNRQDMRDFDHYSEAGNIEPVSGALFRLLQQLIASQISSESIENAAATLDPEILAIAVEEEVETADSDKWAASLSETYVAWQAQASGMDIEPLVRSAKLAAQNVFDLAPDTSRRRLYAQTGLSSYSCDALSRFVDLHEGELREFMLNANYDDMKSVNQLVIDSSLHLPEAQTTTGFAGDIEVLLNLWLDGNPIAEIAPHVLQADDSPEQLSRYIEDLFGYRLPWIISALFRIAKESAGIKDHEVSEYIRCYPSMVKYGLPDPVATWAMSAGIATRGVARRLAEAFEERYSHVYSHENFATWLSNLSDDSLRHDFGVTGYVLDDLRYKLGRTMANPFLKPIRPLHEVLPIEMEVVGVAYENRRMAARRVKAGDQLELHRDYENPVDPNAVAVVHGSGQIGFLPRDLAQRLAPEIDAGNTLVAEALSTMEGVVPVVTARIF